VSRNRVLLMDEVDGMAGNEDRGGIQELIQLIKNSSIPIVCMCTDRNHQKMRSLVNYCFDLKFTTPRLEQIRVGASLTDVFPTCCLTFVGGDADDLLQRKHSNLDQSFDRNYCRNGLRRQTDSQPSGDFGVDERGNYRGSRRKGGQGFEEGLRHGSLGGLPDRFHQERTQRHEHRRQS
jgi:hypothetical protein